MTSRKSLISEMDHSVKRMLKLIEEDGDSFAKKAEMYYQKRPELISIVEEFYRMYRSLAERYDHAATGEFRGTLHSQGSGISDISFEMASSTSPSPDRRTSRKSGPRAAGFDFFLGSAGNSLDSSNKFEGYESCTLDYDESAESDDDSSVNNYSAAAPGNGEYRGLRMRIIELEVELRDVKEKLRLQHHHGNAYIGCSFKETKKWNADEELLRDAKEKIMVLEEENARLKAGIAEADDGLQQRLDEFKSKYEMVIMERDEMNAKMIGLVDEVSFRDERIDEMSRDLHELRMEHVVLNGEREGAHKLVEEMRMRVRGLEREVERHRAVIMEGAEEKREAIRQLCFSLEHYRNGYHRLREAFMGHKRIPIMPTEFIK
ncbi:protein NETWORKED 4A-like [Cornus florida]|uniref:protein NETWORKED 4A-like n=1 Tax=Cornus florida TaxID=4283 RepID=UPI00289A7244|nr:protein NETWORKED 4A-like [Cornus florida]